MICLLCKQDLGPTRAEKVLKLSPSGAEIEITEAKQIFKVPFVSNSPNCMEHFSTRLAALTSLLRLFYGHQERGGIK